MVSSQIQVSAREEGAHLPKTLFGKIKIVVPSHHALWAKASGSRLYRKYLKGGSGFALSSFAPKSWPAPARVGLWAKME